MPQGPRRWRTPDQAGARLVVPRGSAPEKREARESSPRPLGVFRSLTFPRGPSRSRAASRGLALCWEWISTRAFDFGQVKLHGRRLRCQDPGQGLVFASHPGRRRCLRRSMGPGSGAFRAPCAPSWPSSSPTRKPVS